MAETQTPDALDDDGLSPEVGLELDSLRSVERAALLMLLLGEQQASNIVGYLNPKEVQALGTAMVTVKPGMAPATMPQSTPTIISAIT